MPQKATSAEWLEVVPASARFHDGQNQASIHSYPSELAVIHEVAVSIKAIFHCITPSRCSTESDTTGASNELTTPFASDSDNANRLICWFTA